LFLVFLSFPDEIDSGDDGQRRGREAQQLQLQEEPMPEDVSPIHLCAVSVVSAVSALYTVCGGNPQREDGDIDLSFQPHIACVTGTATASA
jgi:hypothetical protein